MNGLVSFHPVDLNLVEAMFTPLIAGGKVQPETFVTDAIALYRNGRHAMRYAAAVAEACEAARPPAPSTSGGFLSDLKTRMAHWDWQPDEIARIARDRVESDIHLEGRPFFVTEGSAERVAALVEEYRTARSGEAADSLAFEQVVRLDSNLARALVPPETLDIEPDLMIRRNVLDRLRQLYDLPRAARAGETWRGSGEPSRPALEALEDSLAWRVVACHGLARPFWVARDVDGLDTVCRAAGVEPPTFLVPAFRLLGRAATEFPGALRSLSTEISGPRGVGAFVEPADVSELLAFLGAHGARIIREASRHGEGAPAAALLKKMRECATYAEIHGFAYVEASGIVPPWWGSDTFPL